MSRRDGLARLWPQRAPLPYDIRLVPHEDARHPARVRAVTDALAQAETARRLRLGRPCYAGTCMNWIMRSRNQRSAGSLSWAELQAIDSSAGLISSGASSARRQLSSTKVQAA